jgi:hypothetical protein
MAIAAALIFTALQDPTGSLQKHYWERVRIARCAKKPPVSREDLSGKLARLGIQITQTSISKIESRSRYYLIMKGRPSEKR